MPMASGIVAAINETRADPEEIRIVFALKAKAVDRRGRHQETTASATAQSPAQ
jgi:hypothetical protein